MVHLYKEVQPADHFDIEIPHLLSSNERQLITLFYQPLTGPEPISLYFMLWAEGENVHKRPMNHYHLMNVLDMSIRKVFEARIALEAIGLLRSYRKDSETERQFIYELVPPLDAKSFFQDPLLSMFLFSKIGEQAYRNLRNRYVNIVKKDGYEEVSRTFVDVYKPVHFNVPQDHLEIKKEQKSGYSFYYEQFDFQLLMSGLSEQLIPASSITLEMKEIIAKVAFLYHLSPLDMQKVVILALDDQLKLSSDRLRKAAADYYKLTISKEAPKLKKTFEQKQPVEKSEQLTKEQELLHYLETTPPVQVLRDINNGKEPLPSSIQLAEDLIMKHGMPVGVVNVLLEYVMLTTDMKLPQKYVEKIADHWIRKNLKTAKEAMELARTERDQYTKWKNDNNTKQPTEKQSSNYKKQPYQRKSGREEKVPEWFYKRNETTQQEQHAQATVQADVDFEKERQKILQKLKNKMGR